MKQQTITFSSMNSDISDKFKKDGMYKKMINCRANNINAEGGGVVETINSNLQISNLSFGETVEYVGGCQDYKRNAIVGFYKGLGTLYITSYSVDTKIESFLLKSAYIDFSRRVTHSGVMDDYLFWIDGEYKLRKFNVNNASDSPLTESASDQLVIDKFPPLYPPTIVASEDIVNVANNIGNIIFQYAYCYQYDDGEKSSWSPISKSVVPVSTDDKDKEFPNNLHTITVNTGGSNVSKILIAARQGEDRDFLLIDTIDKEEEGILDDIAYDYAFYNSRSTTGLVQADIIKTTFNPFYYFKTMAIANDNFLALGGIKDGLENTDVSLSLDYHVKGTSGRYDGFKTGASHSLAIVFRDENGRTAGVCAEESIDIPSYPQLKQIDNVLTDAFNTDIDWTVTGVAPLWAKTMSLVYLGNTSMSYFIQHLIGAIYDRQDYTYIDISPLNLASQTGSTTDITASAVNIEPYVWQKGDRIRFLTNVTGDILITVIDLEVLGYVPEKIDTGGNILYKETIYVDKFDWGVEDIGKYSKYEIYRPKKEFNDKIYYETGNVYEVINGVIQTQSGRITEGDIWRRQRTYDTRQIGEVSLSSDYEYSEYQGSDVTLDLSAVGKVDGLQNQSPGTPFYVSTEDTTITLDGSFKIYVEWREGYTIPYPLFVIGRPGSNNNETIDIPYTTETITPSGGDLNAAIMTGTIDYSDISMPEGSMITLNLRVINKHRVSVLKGSSCYFNILVQNDDEKNVDFYVEDKNYSDYFDSDEHSQGRPYTELDVINPNRLLNNIVTTGNYFADTEIDDTNKIDDTVTYIPYQYGEIEALRIVGDVLKCLTASKEISLYLGREQYVDGAGNVQTSLSTTKLGRINVPSSDYGTTNPESILISGRSMYYYDRKNGCVVASNPNGQVDIGGYGYKTFLRQITALINAATVSEVHMGYNDKNTEVIITFVYDGESDTVVFNERDNLWTHHLENTNGAGQPSQGMMFIGENLLVYLGKPYLHEQGADKLNFFGDAKTATIVGVINQEPINTKILQSMSYQATDKWYVTIESEKMDGWPLGQYTEISTGRQVSKESIYFADVPYNLRRKDGTINKLFYAKGTPMRCRVAAFTMTNSNTSPVQLDEFSVMYINSPTQ